MGGIALLLIFALLYWLYRKAVAPNRNEEFELVRVK